MAGPVIEVNNLVTSFGTNIVHDHISFSIVPGKIIGLIGGSGSGKSVLLRAINGLLRPTEGSVKVFGTDIWASNDQQLLNHIRSRIGVLFQNGALFSALTVGENVAAPIKEELALADELVEFLVELRLSLGGLSPDVKYKMPSELSGGMRKRAALARALALEPEVLFLDEPTSGLDPINARAFDDLVRTLCDNLGITIILVTHDLDTIEGIVDRLIVLGEKRIIADGTVADVKGENDPWITSYFAARAHGTKR